MIHFPVTVIQVTLLFFQTAYTHDDRLKRYKKAKIRKRCNQKKVPAPQTEVGKKTTNNQVNTALKLKLRLIHCPKKTFKTCVIMYRSKYYFWQTSC